MKKICVLFCAICLFTSCVQEKPDVVFESEYSNCEFQNFGDIEQCSHHTLSYHTIYSELIGYVGEAGFNKWVNDHSKEDINIINFIEEFEISEDIFRSIYFETINYYMDDHPIDLLYSDDLSAAEEYYCNIEESNERLRDRAQLFEMKLNIAKQVDGEVENLRKTSIIELMNLADNTISAEYDMKDTTAYVLNEECVSEMMDLSDPIMCDEYCLENIEALLETNISEESVCEEVVVEVTIGDDDSEAGMVVSAPSITD